jgi:DNA-binding transcriptional ArsR family regulator
MRVTIHFVDMQSAPSLLPIFRSRQQAEILALLLGDPDLELSLTDLARRLGVPYPSVHREIERAEAAGIVSSRKIGNTRLVRANVASPYYAGLSDVLTKAFGVPAVLAHALRGIEGISQAVVYGSWASRYAGDAGKRPVGDIDILVLGSPERDELYAALGPAEERLGRPVQVTIRAADWLAKGEGTFHDTVTSRPMVTIPLSDQLSVG